MTDAHAVRLARTEGVGPLTYRKLVAEAGSAEASLATLPERAARSARKCVRIPDPAEIADEISRVEAMGGRVLHLFGPGYPALLAAIPDAPPVISVLGDPAHLDRRAVGVVGARNASAAGIRLAEALSAELAAAGVCIVSGLARGIDAAAHRAALHTGLTVAAVAGGLDRVYPPEHAALQAEIAQRGCVVTEAPLGTVPQARHFPRRNRLIAGLALGCVIVEAARQSGTMITARLVAGYGRTVFAVPGSPLDPRARGGNELIRNHGAILTEEAADVLAMLPDYGGAALADARWRAILGADPNQPGPGFAEPRSAWRPEGADSCPELDHVRKRVVTLLSLQGVPVDELVRRCQFSVSAVLSVLTELELDGIVELQPGGSVALLPQPFR